MYKRQVLAFLGLTILMWLYFVALRCTRCVGFELETIAFFLSTLSLSVTASSAPGSLFKPVSYTHLPAATAFLTMNPSTAWR